VGERLAAQVEAVYNAKLEQSELMRARDALTPGDAAVLALDAVGSLLDALLFLAAEVADREV
jgi:hypothetical protein